MGRLRCLRVALGVGNPISLVAAGMSRDSEAKGSPHHFQEMLLIHKEISGPRAGTVLVLLLTNAHSCGGQGLALPAMPPTRATHRNSSILAVGLAGRVSNLPAYQTFPTAPFLYKVSELGIK